MSLKRLALSVLVASFTVVAGGTVSGCSDDPPGAPSDGGTTPMDGDTNQPQTRFFLLNFIGLAKPATATSTIVKGYNLDNHVTTSAEDPVGCGQIDYSSGAPDNIEGVDNRLGPVLGGLGDLDIDGELADAINNGDALILGEVRNINNFVNDSSVEISFFIGRVPCDRNPVIDTSTGRIRSGETFEIDPASFVPGTTTPVINFTGSIVNGRLRAGPSDFVLSLPIADADVTLTLRSAEFRIDINSDGTVFSNGVLGGGVNKQEIYDTVGRLQPGFLVIVQGLIDSNADLEPDGEGVCQAVSIAVELAGVRAVRGNARVPDAGLGPECAEDAGTPPPRDAGSDAGRDSGGTLGEAGVADTGIGPFDAGSDAGTPEDAGTDAGAPEDAGEDAPPPT